MQAIWSCRTIYTLFAFDCHWQIIELCDYKIGKDKLICLIFLTQPL